MTGESATPYVAALCVFAALAGLALVGVLGRRAGPALRDRIVAVLIGVAGVELASAPALLAALFGDDVLGLRPSDFDLWIVIAVYAALTLFAVVRLFPWREVEAIAAEPGASLRDIMTRIMARPDDGDEHGPP